MFMMPAMRVTLSASDDFSGRSVMTTSTMAEKGEALPNGGPSADTVTRWWRVGILAVVALSLGLAVLAAVFGRPIALSDDDGPPTADQQRTLAESTARDDYVAVVHAVAALHGLSVTDVPELQDFQPFLPVGTRFAATRSLPDDAKLRGWERQVLLLNKKIFHLRHEFHERVQQSYVWLQVFQWISILVSAATTLVVALNTHGLTAAATQTAGTGGDVAAWPHRWKWALGMAALLLSTVTTVIGSVGSFYGPQQDYANKSTKLAGLTALHAEIAFTVASLDPATGSVEKSRLDDWVRRFTEIGVNGTNNERKGGESEAASAALRGPE